MSMSRSVWKRPWAHAMMGETELLISGCTTALGCGSWASSACCLCVGRGRLPAAHESADEREHAVAASHGTGSLDERYQDVALGAWGWDNVGDATRPGLRLRRHIWLCLVEFGGTQVAKVLAYRQADLGAFMKMLEIRNRNQLHTFSSFTVVLHARPQCLHIECMEPVLGHAAICSRCGIVRFCTREAALHLPHKTICKNIQHVRAATLLGEDAAWNRTVHGGELHRSPVKLAEACMAGSVDPRIAEAVWQEIASLPRKSRKRFTRLYRILEVSVNAASTSHFYPIRPLISRFDRPRGQGELKLNSTRRNALQIKHTNQCDHRIRGTIFLRHWNSRYFDSGSQLVRALPKRKRRKVPALIRFKKLAQSVQVSDTNLRLQLGTVRYMVTSFAPLFANAYSISTRPFHRFPHSRYQEQQIEAREEAVQLPESAR
ncbi:hypothetical protein B0H13DRAFT_1878534 [Mycena leptocephala]|nr:hypothetical protein B0H13DRAFT_1878534 [Mycena leptocephala]